jgi:hypothetical protein
MIIVTALIFLVVSQLVMLAALLDLGRRSPRYRRGGR